MPRCGSRWAVWPLNATQPLMIHFTFPQSFSSPHDRAKVRVWPQCCAFSLERMSHLNGISNPTRHFFFCSVRWSSITCHTFYGWMTSWCSASPSEQLSEAAVQTPRGSDSFWVCLWPPSKYFSPHSLDASRWKKKMNAHRYLSQRILKQKAAPQFASDICWFAT